MNSAAFKKLVTKHLAPRIRTLGWKGSGFIFRKIEDNHVVKVFGIQGGRYGGSVHCETAIHFDFIPDLAGRPFNKATHASCIIRKRLYLKDDGGYSWNFSDNEEDNIHSINQIWEAFSTHGQRFYKDFDNFPEPFSSMNPKDFNQANFFGLGKKKRVRILNKYDVNNNIHLVWLLKEVNIIIGRTDLAIDFAELGMKMTYDHANEMAEYTKGVIDQVYVDKNKEMFRIG